MTARSFTFPAAFLALILPCKAPAQELAARDAFWSSSDLITVTPNPAAHKNAAAHPRPHPQSAPERSSQVAELVAENGYGAAPHLVRTAQDRLGLRCSILLRGVNKEYNEVAPGTIFHSGDHIRLSFLANQAGYFYVIQQGSTGTWSPVFPPPNSGAGANRISAGQLQTVPAGTKFFLFDQNPGDEKLYVILSRTPISDLDRAIQNLKSGQPASSPEPQSGNGAMVEAENRIPDAFVQGIASRDLILADEQKVDESSKGGVQGEKAIYVVSKASSGLGANSQVVVKLDLQHE
jgi:hypothetical protein